ncbi:MAG: hypothetical protein RR061_00580 [Muribaculaceae bacterium]
MKVYRYMVLSALIAFGAIAAVAQGSITPYSKYGYGLLNDNATSMQRSMGGVGYAMSNGRQINVMNPASYAAIDSLTFLWDIGLDVTSLSSKENGKSGSSFGGGLDYITMQFPLGKYMGGSLGLMPYSSVGYSFGGDIKNGTDSRLGSGGINQLYAGVSGRPFKGFTVGANFSYLFGTILNDVYATTTSGVQTLFEQVMQIRDWNVNIGLQYSHNFSKKHKGTIGLVYTPGKSFLGHTWGTYYEINTETKVKPDTIGYTSLKDKYTSAHTFGGGLSYTYDNRLNVEADFTFQNWKNAKFAKMERFEPTILDNRWKIALGAQFTPKLRGNYLQRMNYRIGTYYNHDYIMVKGNNIREYGVSIGFGLPTPSTKTIINLGFEYKRREAYPASLITENYFNITLGVNFNELWFWQNKIK